jgi:hypothetical protein
MAGPTGTIVDSPIPFALSGGVGASTDMHNSIQGYRTSIAFFDSTSDVVITRTGGVMRYDKLLAHLQQRPDRSSCFLFLLISGSGIIRLEGRASFETVRGDPS